MKKIFTLLFLFSTAAEAQNTIGEVKLSPTIEQGKIFINSIDTADVYFINPATRFGSVALKNTVATSEKDFYSFVAGSTLNYNDGSLLISGSESSIFSGFKSQATVTNANFILHIDTINYFDSIIRGATISFTSYADRGEILYKGKNEISRFEFYDNELLSNDGTSLAIEKITVSGSISSLYSAMQGNGAFISQQGVYRETWSGSDLSQWAILSAPTSLNGVSLTLFASANLATNNTYGEFAINIGGGNEFSFGTNDSVGYIGWNNSLGQITLNANRIETNAEILQHAVYKSSLGIAVCDNCELTQLTLPVNLQGYFTSNNSGSSGIMVENSNIDPRASVGIGFKLEDFNSWIGIAPADGKWHTSSSGTLVISSGGEMLLSASSYNGSDEEGSIQFMINSKKVGKITTNSFVIGATEEDPSSILTIESDSRGILLPRMTSEQRKKIKQKKGLIVYDITIEAICVSNGKRWKQLCSKFID